MKRKLVGVSKLHSIEMDVTIGWIGFRSHNGDRNASEMISLS